MAYALCDMLGYVAQTKILCLILFFFCCRVALRNCALRFVPSSAPCERSVTQQDFHFCVSCFCPRPAEHQQRPATGRTKGSVFSSDASFVYVGVLAAWFGERRRNDGEIQLVRDERFAARLRRDITQHDATRHNTTQRDA